MKKISFLLLFLILTNTAFAIPTMSSGDNQTFTKNQKPSEIYDIIITEDPNETFITAGTLKIIIPDSLPIIFDSHITYSYLAVYGTAVDSGKVQERPIVRFENNDKTLKIPVLADFAPGESITITEVYLEGFNDSSTSSANLIMEINGEQYEDEYFIDIDSSTLSDKTEPDLPTDISIQDHADGVQVTWTDPTDLDLNTIQILRGINEYAISGTPYEEIGPGIQEFIDTEVVEGDTVKYIFRSSDGVNFSEQSEEYDYVVGSVPVEEEEEPEEEEQIEEPEEESEEEPTEEPEEEIQSPFEDVENHWAIAEIAKLAEEGIVTGQTSTIFNPDSNLNRAEAAAIIYRILNLGEPETPAEPPFPDVAVNEWYAGYINELANLDLINGHADGTFKPADNITRAEFFALALNLYNYLADESTKGEIELLKTGPKTSAYSDLGDDWYTPVITALTKLNFISGSQCGDEKCAYANTEITRAEAVIPLYGMFFSN